MHTLRVLQVVSSALCRSKLILRLIQIASLLVCLAASRSVFAYYPAPASMGAFIANSTIHVFVTQSSGCSVDMWTRPLSGGSWTVTQSLGSYTGYTCTASGPDGVANIVTYYSSGDNTDHVFYIGIDAHVHELYCNDASATNPSNWGRNDLSQHTNMPNAEGDYTNGVGFSTLSGFYDSGGIEHVFFVDSTQIIHEIYHNSGGWWGGYASSEKANATMGQGMATEFDGCQHVYFDQANANVLWEAYNCGSWQLHVPVSSLTTQTTPIGYLSATFDSFNTHTQYISGVQANGAGLMTISYGPSHQWVVTETSPSYISTTCPQSYPSVPFAGFSDFYIGTDRHVRDQVTISGGPNGDWTGSRNWTPAGIYNNQFLSPVVETFQPTGNAYQNIFFIDNNGVLRTYDLWFGQDLAMSQTGDYTP